MPDVCWEENPIPCTKVDHVLVHSKGGSPAEHDDPFVVTLVELEAGFEYAAQNLLDQNVTDADDLMMSLAHTGGLGGRGEAASDEPVHAARPMPVRGRRRSGRDRQRPSIEVRA
jgi:hypothetical protein